MKGLNFYISIIFSALFVATACKTEDDEASSCIKDFPETSIYQDVANNLIIPGYTALLSGLEEFETSAHNFIANADVSSLQDLQDKWYQANLLWQAVAPFEFGPAETVFLRSTLNNFPANIDQINANIENGNYNLDTPDSFDKGFPALDYLLFGLASDEAAIVEKYTTDALAVNYQTYLTNVITQMKSTVSTAYSGWTTENYTQSFIENTGTAAGSSLSLIINNLNQHYEIIKREKIGVPAGVLTLGFPNPDKVEAPFSGKSAELALAALEASFNFYTAGGTGLDDLLNFVGAQKDGKALDQVIRDQYTAARLALVDLIGTGKTLAEIVAEEGNQSAVEAYNEITKQVVNLKTDMPSVLCVAITYVDNPSDSD